MDSLWYYVPKNNVDFNVYACVYIKHSIASKPFSFLYFVFKGLLRQGINTPRVQAKTCSNTILQL